MNEITDVTLMDQLDEVAAFEPNGFPFIILYLNMQPDQSSLCAISASSALLLGVSQINATQSTLRSRRER